MSKDDIGFWGRTCSRLSEKNKELESENAALKEEVVTLKREKMHMQMKVVRLIGNLEDINDLAPPMHVYTDIEYEMVMITREALKGE